MVQATYGVATLGASNRNVVVVGSGRIGVATATLLAGGGYSVTVLDSDRNAFPKGRPPWRGDSVVADASDRHAMTKILQGADAVVAAASWIACAPIASAALESGVHYFDLTEDRQTTESVRQIADGARCGQLFVPQCGLAPGFVSIVANKLASQYEQIADVRIRVGALPRYPTNLLRYNLTWSTEGLINEYCNPCEIIRDGRIVEVAALDGLETLSVDGVDYEAFFTSGGLGTLCESLARQGARSLDYKTLRYPGHRDFIALLLDDLRLRDDRGLLAQVMEKAIPLTRQDVVVLRCSASGWRHGRLEEATYARVIQHLIGAGRSWSAIQITTSAAVAAVIDMALTGDLLGEGFVAQEAIDLEQFQRNRFGAIFENPALFSELVANG